MSDPPSGTVTFLFTDIQGSTRLLDKLRVLPGTIGLERIARRRSSRSERQVVRSAAGAITAADRPASPAQITCTQADPDGITEKDNISRRYPAAAACRFARGDAAASTLPSAYRSGSRDRPPT